MAVTLHTSLGDLKLHIFCEEVPVAAEVCYIGDGEVVALTIAYASSGGK